MKLSRFLILFVTFAFIGFAGEAQNENIDFPASFQGNWKGDLEIFSVNGLQQTIPMEFIIQPIEGGRYEWSIIYGDDKETGKRAYELITVNDSLGHFQIDEKNSIVLDGYLLGEKFYQQFEISDNLLVTSLEKKGENLIFEILFGSFESISTTGGEIVDGEQIPKVQSFQLKIRQVALLSR